MKAIPRPLVIGLIVGPLFLASCLKTRAQLREDTADKDVNPVARVDAGGGYAIDEVKNEITHLTGRIEDMERAQKDRGEAKASDAEIQKLQERISKLEESNQKLLELLEKNAASSASVPATDPAALFHEGRKFYQAGKYDQALETLGEYLKSPQAKSKEEAIYLRGESYYLQKKYKRAIVEYSQFPEKFSQSKYVPQALYRIGLSFDALGMKTDAAAFYKELVERFPKSQEAQKAKRNISGNPAVKS